MKKTRMTGMIPVFSAVLLLLGCPAPVYGAFINDKFESDAVGSNPAGWTVVENGDTYGTDNVSVVAGNGGKAVQITKISRINGSPIVSQNFTAGSPTLLVEFDYMFTDRLASPNLRLLAGNAITVQVRMTFNEDAQRPAYVLADGTTWNHLEVNLVTNTWYHFKIEIDVANKMSIQVSGAGIATATASNLDLVSGRTVNTISQIQFRYASAITTGDYTIDNVLVADSEPKIIKLILFTN